MSEPIQIPIMRPFLGVEEQEAAAAAIASGWIAQGPRVAEFERAFAAHLGSPHAVAVSNCTTGLHLALHVLGVGPSDEVVVPSLSFIATANVAQHVGATPVFADVDLSTQNVTAESVEAVITDRTRAVIVVDQAGMPADIDSIAAVCDPRGISIVEDAACAIGSTYRGRPVASAARLGVFSFHPRKILTTGEGGMVVTTDEALATRLTRLREHGMSVSALERHASGSPVLESYLEMGFNFRMTDIQAAVGLVQLGRLPEVVARRREIAASYQSALADVSEVAMPSDPSWGTTNYQSFCVLLVDDSLDRDGVMSELAADGVSSRRGIMAAHLEPAYEHFTHTPLPVTERLTRRSLILPIFHEMTEAEIDRVVTSLRCSVDSAHRGREASRGVA